MIKFLKDNAILIFVLSCILAVSTQADGNEIYVNQSGANLDLDITQDGQNNQIEGLSGSGSALLRGSNNTVSFTQTGDSNQIRVWSDSSSGKSMTTSQTGNSNISLVDNHGQDNTITTDVDGNSNYTFDEIGNGGDTDNSINTIVTGNSNNVIVEVQNGDNNTLDMRIKNQDDNIARMYVNGNNNNVKAWQGKHEDGSVDSDEHGDNDVYWYVTGNSNTLASYQTDTSDDGGLYIFNDIDGSSNNILITQRGNGNHKSILDVNGDSNDIDILQRGNNSNSQYLTLTVDDGHTVDVYQRYGDHTATINLTNAGGGYNLDLDQTDNSSDRSYSLTGTCANSNGCGVTVTQN